MTRRPVDRYSAAGAGLLVGLLVSVAVAAQESAGELEEIVVTGSRLARPDFESASPIVTLAGAAFERTNASSVETVVSRLPQFVPSIGSTSNNPANGGQGNLQLRGLGETATLVLVDGRRLTPANGNGVVDVNVIPSALIESVEVVTGGASAVYGSDAIAGVVNFKLKDEFEGLQFDGVWGQTDRGDGSEYSAGLTAGVAFADGRGDAYVHVGYSKRDAVLQADRGFSAVTLDFDADAREFLPQGSPTLLEGRVAFNAAPLRPSLAAWESLFESYGYAPGTVPLLGNGVSFNADGSVFAVGNGTAGSVANFRGIQDPRLANDRRYSYNFAPDNYLQLPLERVTAFGRLSFDLTDAAQAYAELVHADYTADTQLAPAPAMPIVLPASNPFIPADFRRLLDSRPSPGANFAMSKRLGELGARQASNDSDLLQGTLGLRGDVGEGWSYEAYVQAGAYDSSQSQEGFALRSRIQELTFAPDGGVAVCGGLDLFGPGSVSRACAEYFTVDGTNSEGFDQAIAEVSATGPVYSLPAGELRLAVGLMYKNDEYFYRADPIASVILPDGQPDVVGFNASDDIEGDESNTDVYLEALVPLLAGRSGVEQLDLVFGYRHSDYSRAGGADAYKAEVLWRPLQSLRIRGSWQRAVRAPSVFELYAPLLPVSYFNEFDVKDPCEADSAQRNGPDAASVEALCLAQGVPAASLAEFADSDGEHFGLGGGNPDLDPEQGDTLTAGLVLQSGSSHPLWSEARVSLDWYLIEVDNAIVDTLAIDYVPRCYDGAANPSFSPDYESCRYFSRDPASGEIVDLQDFKRNVLGYEVSGIDLQLDWTVPAGRGELSLNWLVSWMERYDVRSVEGLPSTDEAGFVGSEIGGSLPEWKWNFNLAYALGALSTNLQWRYVDGMRDRDEPAFGRYPSYDVFDLYAAYDFAEGLLAGLTLRAGVENLGDEAPLLLASQVQANTDPSQYDTLGRRYFVGASYRF